MATFSDDFNRANGAIGANYTTYSGSSTPQISSNQIVNSGGDATTVRTAETFGDDQEAYCTFIVSGSVFAWVGCRAQADGSQYIEASYDPGAGTLQVWRKNPTDGESAVGSAVTGLATSGTHTVGLRVVSNSAQMTFDGVDVGSPVSVPNTPTGGKPVMGGYNAGGSLAYDNFNGGDYTAPSTYVAPKLVVARSAIVRATRW